MRGKRLDAMQNFRERINAFRPGLLDWQRLDQQVNVIWHHARRVTLQLVTVPKMAGGQSFCTGGGRQNQFILRVPGYVIGAAGNLKMWKIAFARGGFGDWRE